MSPNAFGMVRLDNAHHLAELGPRLAGRPWYVSTPFSPYADKAAAWSDACHSAWVLASLGIPVVAPIAQSWAMEREGGASLPHEHWMAIDASLVGACGGLIAVMLPGWEISRGMEQAIRWAL